MPGPLDILQHTPVWAFALLALLVVLGVQALRPRRIAMWRLLAVPGVFIAWGLITLAQRSVGAPVLLADWLVAAAVGLTVGCATVRLDAVVIDRGLGLVQTPASMFPLLRNVVIFAAKYGLAATMAIAPASRAGLISWDVAISGLTAGYFMGWLIRFGLKYRSSALPVTLTSQ